MKTEEQEYIKRILGGEMELYGYFLDTYGHRIFTLVQQMVSNREDAEDITQDIFVKAYESLKRYRFDTPQKQTAARISFFQWEYTRTYRERRVGDSFRYNR